MSNVRMEKRAHFRGSSVWGGHEATSGGQVAFCYLIRALWAFPEHFTELNF